MNSLKSKNLRMTALGMVFSLTVLTSACATKKFVRKNAIEPLEAKIGSVDKKVDEADGRITSLDQKTERGISNAQSAADKAGQQADKAENDAQQAQNLANQGLNETHQLQGRVENIDNYQPVKNETVLFGFDRSNLTKEDQQKLDELVQSVAEMKHYVIEVQGYTDKTGTRAYNLELSRRRAEEVTRYLTAHNVPLVRIHELGYGSEPPASTEVQTDKRALRKMSRRVEVKVLAPPAAGAPRTEAQVPSSPSHTSAEQRTSPQ